MKSYLRGKLKDPKPGKRKFFSKRGKGRNISKGEKFFSLLFVLSTYNLSVHDYTLQSSSQLHTKNQIIN